MDSQRLSTVSVTRDSFSSIPGQWPEQLQLLQHENQVLKGRVQSLEHQTKQLQAEIEEGKQAAEENKKKKTSSDVMTVHKAKWGQARVSFMGKITEMKLMNANEDAHDELVRNLDEMERLRQEVEDEHLNIHQLHEQIESLTDESQAKDAHIAKINKQLEDACADKETLAEEIQTLKQQLDDGEAEIAHIVSDRMGGDARMSVNMGSLAMDLLEDHGDEMERLAHDVEEQHELVHKLEQEKSAEHEQVEKLQQDNQRLKKAHFASILHEVVREDCDKKACETTRQELYELKILNNELTAKCAELEAQVGTSHNVDVAQWQEHCELLETHLTLAAEKGQEALQEAQDWKTKHHMMQQYVKEMEMAQGQFQKQSEELQQEVTRLSEGTGQEGLQEAQDWKIKHQEMHQYVKDMEIAQEQLQKQSEDLRQEVARLSEEAGSHLGQSSPETSKNHMEIAPEQKEEHEEEVSRLQEQSTNLRGELENARHEAAKALDEARAAALVEAAEHEEEQVARLRLHLQEELSDQLLRHDSEVQDFFHERVAAEVLEEVAQAKQAWSADAAADSVQDSAGQEALEALLEARYISQAKEEAQQLRALLMQEFAEREEDIRHACQRRNQEELEQELSQVHKEAGNEIRCREARDEQELEELIHRHRDDLLQREGNAEKEMQVRFDSEIGIHMEKLECHSMERLAAQEAEREARWREDASSGCEQALEDSRRAHEQSLLEIKDRAEKELQAQIESTEKLLGERFEAQIAELEEGLSAQLHASQKSTELVRHLEEEEAQAGLRFRSEMASCRNQCDDASERSNELEKQAHATQKAMELVWHLEEEEVQAGLRFQSELASYRNQCDDASERSNELEKQAHATQKAMELVRHLEEEEVQAGLRFQSELASYRNQCDDASDRSNELEKQLERRDRALEDEVARCSAERVVAEERYDRFVREAEARYTQELEVEARSCSQAADRFGTMEVQQREQNLHVEIVQLKESSEEGQRLAAEKEAKHVALVETSNAELQAALQQKSMLQATLDGCKRERSLMQHQAVGDIANRCAKLKDQCEQAMEAERQFRESAETSMALRHLIGNLRQRMQPPQQALES